MKRTLRDIWYAVSRPDAYREFMHYRKKNLIFYVLFLVLSSFLLTILLPSAGFLASGGFGRILREEIPDFRASNDGFWIEEPIEIDEYNVLIRANSDVVYEDIQDLDGQYGSYDNVIIADKEQIYIRSVSMPEIRARFSEMDEFTFTKEDMLSYVPVIYMIYAWIFFFACLMNFGFYFLTALATSWIAGLIASFMRLQIGSTPLFKMAVYAGTASWLLTTILSLLRIYAQVSVSIPDFFGYLLTLGYMYFGLKDYKDNLAENAA